MGLRTQRRCPWASLTHVRLLGCHHVCMADPMSLAWQQAVDGFAEHLRDERNRSAHTVRAYLADVNDLVGFCADRDIESPAQLAPADTARVVGRRDARRLVSFHDCAPGRLGSRIHGVVQCAGHVRTTLGIDS